MAILTNHLDDLEASILEIMGYSASTLAPWGTSQKLYTRINTYGQRLPMRLNTIARELVAQGELQQDDLPLHFDCWKTISLSGTSTTTGPQVTSATSIFYLPVDYDHYISFYDTTLKQDIPVVDKADKYFAEDLVDENPGCIKAIEIAGYTSISSTWRRVAYFYPTPIGIPSLRLTYYRIPAIMPGSDIINEFPDIDPKYAALFIYGPACELSRFHDPSIYGQYSQLEKEMLVEMCLTARSR